MESDYNRVAKMFKFNLIPPKSKEEVAQLVERDNTVLYSFILIFSSAIVFFILTLLDAALVKPAQQNVATQITGLESQLTNFREIKTKNGELFIKSRALEPLLEKDIKLSKLIDLADKLVTSQGDSIQVINYKRETTGEFVLTLSLGTFDKVETVVTQLVAEGNISDIFLRTIGRDTNVNRISMVVSFNINLTAEDLKAEQS